MQLCYDDGYAPRYQMMEEFKETSLERWFGWHFNSVKDRLGEQKAKEYARVVEPYLHSVAHISGLSALLLLFLIMGLDSLDGKAMMFGVAIVALLIFYVFAHLSDVLKNNDVIKDESLARTWKLISLGLSGIAVLCSVFYLYNLYPHLGFVSEDKPEVPCQVSYEELGITINIPPGWSEPKWEYKSDESARRPQYRFRATNAEHTMWFYVYGWSTPPRYQIEDFMINAIRSSKDYFDNSQIEVPHLVDIGGRKVYRSVGTRKEAPDHIYVFYQDLHCCSMVCYTYRFKKHLPYKEEMASAEKIYSMIGFEDVDVPIYKTVEDARPDDYSTGDDFVDIASASMKIMTPGQLEWEEKTRTVYKFSCPLDGYDITFDVKVVYTAETATLEEFEVYLEEDMTSFMNGGFIISPSIAELDNIKVFRAAGKCKADRANINVRYQMLHKGALLTVSAAVPTSLPLDENIDSIEDVIEQIQFY